MITKSQVKMYYRSGTGIRYCIQLSARPGVHSSGSSTFL